MQQYGVRMLAIAVACAALCCVLYFAAPTRPDANQAGGVAARLEVVTPAERVATLLLQSKPPTLRQAARLSRNPIRADWLRAYARLRITNCTPAPVPRRAVVGVLITAPNGQRLQYCPRELLSSALLVSPPPVEPPVEPGVEVVLAEDLFGVASETLRGCRPGRYTVQFVLDFGAGPVMTNKVFVDLTQDDFDQYYHPPLDGPGDEPMPPSQPPPFGPFLP